MELVEAQDYILEVLGSTPSGDINSLNPDAQGARRELARISNGIQKRGWWFNTDYNVVLTPSPLDKEILLPSNTLKVLPKVIGSNKRQTLSTFQAGQNFVQRGIKLYDVDSTTYQFDQPVTVDLVVFMAWDLLPTEMQDYIQYESAARRCSIDLEDEIKASAQKEMAAIELRELRKTNMRAQKINMLQSPRVARFLSGIRPYRTGR